jgi:Protein of unknown function (DUF2510)
MAAPGWYDDPNAAGAQRWWDGNQWTEHVQQQAAALQAQAPAATPFAPAVARPAEPRGPYPPARIALAGIAGFAILLLIVGSIGTWVDASSTGSFGFSATRGGLDRDGAITLTLAILSLILVGVWAARIGPAGGRIALAAVAAFFGLIAVLISIADVIDVETSGNSIIETSAGWGLWLCLLASLALLGTMLVAVAVRPLR